MSGHSIASGTFGWIWRLVGAAGGHRLSAREVPLRVVCALALAFALAPAPALATTTFTVNVNTDSNPTGGGVGTGTVGDLRYCLTQADASSGSTIALQSGLGTITLAADLPAIVTSMTLEGNSNTLSGGNQFRGLFVYSGTVTIQDLTITNAMAQGGAGGNGGGGG